MAATDNPRYSKAFGSRGLCKLRYVAKPWSDRNAPSTTVRRWGEDILPDDVPNCWRTGPGQLPTATKGIYLHTEVASMLVDDRYDQIDWEV